MNKNLEQFIPIVNIDKNPEKNYARVVGGCNFIKLRLSYNIGGANIFSGKNERRGYYLSATPVLHKDGMISTALGSGVKRLVLEVSRQSDKQFKNALLQLPEITPKLLEWCKQEYRY